MDRSTPLDLLTISYSADTIGQQVATTTTKSVFVDLKSVTRTEWTAAGEMGHNAEFVASMFAPDYDGEQTCLLDGKTYSIYRTYYDMRHETVELYLEKKVGDYDGQEEVSES